MRNKPLVIGRSLRLRGEKMKRISVLSFRTMAILASLFLALASTGMVSVVHAQRTTPTAPNLTEAGVWVNLSQQGCMDRAREALKAAGLTLQNPSPSAYGGNNADLFAIITCVPCTNRLYVNIAVASAPDRGDTYGTAIFLRDYMSSGQRASTGQVGSPCGPFEGVWKDNYGCTMTFRRTGNSVSATYVFEGGSSSLSGTVSGNVLEGQYFQPSYGDPRYRQGRFRFTLAQDGRSWSGQYWDINGNLHSGGWNGTCVGAITGSSGGGAATGGICADPRTLAIMDEWLTRANPPQNQQPGWSVRYEPWGRLVGSTPSTNLTVSGSPDTRMSRCDWLWYYAASFRSSNLGTLKEYVERRLQ